MKIRSAEWNWHFEAPPSSVWRVLADTARFNEAAGLKKYPVAEIPQPDGSVRFFGRMKKGPFYLSWREAPVNWVTDQWFEHCRYFDKGPLSFLCAGLTIIPDDKGCHVRYRVSAAPRNILGKIILATRFFSSVERAFAPLAESARMFCNQARATPYDYPAPSLAEGARARVAQWVGELESSGYGHGLGEKLGALILDGAEADLWHIRPLSLATRWNVLPRHVIEACLQAVKLGILQLRWTLLCPRCRVAKAGSGSLDQLPHGAHCSSCNIDYDRDFSHNVEVAFQPSAAIRPLQSGEYCLFGPMSTPHIKLHVTVEAHTTRDIPVSFSAGPYRLRSLEPGGETEIDYPGGAFPELIAWYDSAGRHCIGAGDDAPPGQVLLCNKEDRPVTFIIEERSWVQDALTADRLTSLQAFRDIFADEVLRPGDDVSIGQITLMFTDLKGSTALYEHVGDAHAYRLVRDHFAFLAERIRLENGAIVKTIGDAVMAAFANPADAVRAAFAVQRHVVDFNRAHGDGDEIVIKMGLHTGPCIAVTLNDRLDYFGGTVNMAARLQAQSHGGDIVLSSETCRDIAVQDLLRGCEGHNEEAALKGFSRPVQFRRLVVDHVSDMTTRANAS